MKNNLRGFLFNKHLNKNNMNITKIFKSKKHTYNHDKIDSKHNLWRIENDLNWIFKDKKNAFNTKISLYWLDINLKNTFFPWILKIERELKSSFISIYKQKFQDSSACHVINDKNYDKVTNGKNPYDVLVRKNLIDKTIDELIFSLTFGEFVNLLLSFNSSIRHKIANDLNFSIDVFSNLIKYLNILRNAVAHNKTVIKIRDDKNNKRFSLEKKLFDFPIDKKEIVIISTNASGSIFVLKKFLEKMDSKKIKFLIKNVNKNLKLFKKKIKNKQEYSRIIKLIFLNYYKNILKI